MTWIPAHSEAANDAAIRGAPLVLYDWLMYQLDASRPRPLNVTDVAVTLGMKRKTVRHGLRLLCQHGYLESSGTSTRTRAYRLLLNRVRAIGPPRTQRPPAA